MKGKWLDGENLAPLNSKKVKALLGKKVVFVIKGRTDPYRGWCSKETGTITCVTGRNFELDGSGGNWFGFSNILEMIEATP